MPEIIGAFIMCFLSPNKPEVLEIRSLVTIYSNDFVQWALIMSVENLGHGKMI